MLKKILMFMMSILLMCGCTTTDNQTSNEDEVSDLPSEFIPDGNTPTQNPPTGGGEVEPTPFDPNADYLVSRVVTLEGNKTYLEVDGKPYAIRGGQVRLDGLINRYNDDPNQPAALTDSEIEEYFKVAKQIGLNTLEIPIEWRRIEPEKDQYDFSLVDRILTMANNQGMKVEILWFSVNMCGDSCKFQMPDYIFNDSNTYSRFTCDKQVISAMYGEMTWLIGNDPDLMEREAKALSNMMEHIHYWNIENGKKNPLIGVQIQNEADGMLRWRLDQRQLKYNGQLADPAFMWDAILGGLDNAGKAVKNSKYKVYTRVNLTVTLGTGRFPQFPNHNFTPMDVMNLEGIDIVGDDAYNEEPSVINNDMKQFAILGNYPHIAENMGDYPASPSLFLTTYQAGGSYMFYDMATPEYFVYLNQKAGSDYRMNQGLIQYDFSYKAHSKATIDIINGIKKMDSIVPITKSEDFAAFNVKTQTPVTNYTQTICTSNLEIKYQTTNGGIAFAIEHDGYLYIYSTADCMFNVMNAKYYYAAQIGYYNGSEFVVEEKQALPYPGYDFEVKALKLYRLKITEVFKEVQSTTNLNV